jgi:hypothetical protein
MIEHHWLNFYFAAKEIEQRLSVSGGVAKRMLRVACASGDVRSQRQPCNPTTGIDEGPPEPIKPSDWTRDQLDLVRDADGCKYFVDVDEDDFRYWLNQQPTQPTAGGKQSRIIRLLAEMFPSGVPNRDDCPRQPLTAELIKRDPTLSPLDPKTLKTAIDFYNRHWETLGNARNTSVSD